MNEVEVYIEQVVGKLLDPELQNQVAMDLRSHIAERVERGSSVAEAIRQLGDPAALAESYLAAVPLRSAPLGRRAAAKLVDLLYLYGLPLAVVAAGALVGVPTAESAGNLFPVVFWVTLLGFTLLGCVLYPMIAEHRTGQTLGKRLFGLRVVTESGMRIRFGQAFLRQLPLFLQIFMVDALFALFTEKKQRAFELISKTRVVDAREARAGHGVAASPLAAF